MLANRMRMVAGGGTVAPPVDPVTIELLKSFTATDSTTKNASTYTISVEAQADGRTIVFLFGVVESASPALPLSATLGDVPCDVFYQLGNGPSGTKNPLVAVCADGVVPDGLGKASLQIEYSKTFGGNYGRTYASFGATGGTGTTVLLGSATGSGGTASFPDILVPDDTFGVGAGMNNHYETAMSWVGANEVADAQVNASTGPIRATMATISGPFSALVQCKGNTKAFSTWGLVLGIQ